VLNALSVDIEDYHSLVQRDMLDRSVPPTNRVERNVHALLDLLDEHRVKATLFWLGEVVDRFPNLVREAAHRGHEFGVHGYSHRKVFQIDPGTFRSELRRTKSRLEDLTGLEVIGHRAPAFSITPQCEWAFDVLIETGFRYDSSIFPFRGRRYGWPDAPCGPYPLNRSNGVLLEIPLPIVELAGRRIPVAGGGYLRLFPCAWTIWAIRRINRDRPVVVYMHPYEIETEPYRYAGVRADFRTWIRFVRFDTLQRCNRRTVLRKLARLLQTFTFAPIRTVFQEALASCSNGPERQPNPK